METTLSLFNYIYVQRYSPIISLRSDLRLTFFFFFFLSQRDLCVCVHVCVCMCVCFLGRFRVRVFFLVPLSFIFFFFLFCFCFFCFFFSFFSNHDAFSRLSALTGTNDFHGMKAAVTHSPCSIAQYIATECTIGYSHIFPRYTRTRSIVLYGAQR